MDEAKSDLVGAGYVGRARGGGVALAATIDGTNGNDRLIGTDRADQIDGRGGQDIIRGHLGADILDGGAGSDTLYAGSMDEFAQDSVNGGKSDDDIRAFNNPASKDVIDCGYGFDRAVVDSKDVLSGCNRVVRP